jgi:hypothetical protein
MSNLLQKTFACLLFLALISPRLYAQETELSNRDFLQGNFGYCDNDPADIVIKGKKMIEEFPGKNDETVRIVAKIKWTSDNTYEVKAKKVTGTTLLKKGIVIKVRITSRTDTTMEYHYKFTDGSRIEGMDCFKRIP